MVSPSNVLPRTAPHHSERTPVASKKAVSEVEVAHSPSSTQLLYQAPNNYSSIQFNNPHSNELGYLQQQAVQPIIQQQVLCILSDLAGAASRC